MMTAVELFTEHPKRENMNFIVLPLAREAIHSMGDIASDYKETIKEFSEQLNFDFSLLEKAGYNWQIDTLSEKKK